MTQINSNINFRLHNQPGFKSAQAVPDVQIPDMYYTPDDSYQQTSLKDTIKKVDMFDMIVPWLENPLAMLAICAGMGYGVDKFSQSFSGEYEKSIVGKAAKFGDKIQQSDIIQSKPAQTVIGWGKEGKKRFLNLFKNSDVVNAIRTTPSMPEWTIVKNEMYSQLQRIEEEFISIAEKLKLGEEGMLKMENLGLNKSEKEMIKKIFNVKDIAKAHEQDVVNTILLKRLGRSESEISRIIGMGENASNAVKDEILKEMGLTAEKIALIKKDETGKYIPDVMKAIEKVKGKVRVGAGHYSWLGPIQPFEREIGCDALYNKMHSMTDGAKTATGRFMSKFLQKLHRGFTFGGGKLCVLAFVAPMIFRTCQDTIKASPEQKVGTAAHGILELPTWAFTFPAGLMIMHSLAGAQYAGMSKDKVMEVRRIKNEFNSTNFKNINEYNKALKEAKKQVKALETVKGQNLLTKTLRKLGKFITMDLERFKSYRNGSFLGNTFRKIPGFFKNVAGVPMRLGIWGWLCMGVMDAAIMKCIKGIFGNYYDRMKEEEYEANKKKQKEFTKEDLKNRLLETQRKKLTQPQPAIEELNPEKPITEEKAAEVPTENTLEQAVKTPEEKIADKIQQPKEAQYIPDQTKVITKPQNQTVKRDNYTYIPSQENVLNQKNTEIQNKYIPSQLGANITKTFDNSGLQAALRRADRAEQRAIQTLSGKFGTV